MSLHIIFTPYDQIQEDVHDLYSEKKYFKIVFKPYPAFSLNSGSLSTKIFLARWHI